MTVEHHVGPALDTVATLPTGSVDLCATSPPFLALRNYNNTEGQWGSEATPAAFLDNLLELAVETRRVLAPHGSIAWELGDTYSGSGGAGGDYNPDGLRDGQAKFNGSASKRSNNWPLPKSLTGVPTLFAWSLAYGRNLLNPDHTFTPWRVRNVIVWARNNPPVGALGDKYRPATSYITVATPSAKRWFDLDAVRTEPTGVNYGRQTSWNNVAQKGQQANSRYRNGEVQHYSNPTGAPPLDHWTDEYDGDHTWIINTHGSSLAHYAMWPAALAQRLVLSMCPLEVCTVCGQPRRRITGPAEYIQRGSGNVRDDLGGHSWHSHDADEAKIRGRTQRPTGRDQSVTRSAPTLGWSDCGHNNYRPGRVLDPFAGTGTTTAVADLHNRDATGIDLDPTNTALHQRRYDEIKRALFDVPPPIEGQTALPL